MSRGKTNKQENSNSCLSGVTWFTWQTSSLYCANFSSFPSGSPLPMKASASSSSLLSRSQLSSQRFHSCSRCSHRLQHLKCQHKRPKSSEMTPQEIPLVFVCEFISPTANKHHKPGSSSEKPLPVPEPVAAKLWL